MIWLLTRPKTAWKYVSDLLFGRSALPGSSGRLGSAATPGYTEMFRLTRISSTRTYKNTRIHPSPNTGYSIKDYSMPTPNSTSYVLAVELGKLAKRTAIQNSMPPAMRALPVIAIMAGGTLSKATGGDNLIERYMLGRDETIQLAAPSEDELGDQSGWSEGKHVEGTEGVREKPHDGKGSEEAKNEREHGSA